METLLDVEGLTVQFRGENGWVTAVEDVSFSVRPQEVLGIVGESGSGKSVTALSLLGLHAASGTRIPSGVVRYQGRDLLQMPARALRRIRGGDIAMIFQDPMSSLNPGADGRRPDHRDVAAAPGAGSPSRPQARHRAAGPGAHPRRRAACRRVSAPHVGGASASG